MADNAKWYVLHTYSGYENAVKAAIETAGGAGFGQVLVLRLDDSACFYEPILPGE